MLSVTGTVSVPVPTLRSYNSGSGIEKHPNWFSQFSRFYFSDRHYPVWWAGVLHIKAQRRTVGLVSTSFSSARFILHIKAQRRTVGLVSTSFSSARFILHIKAQRRTVGLVSIYLSSSSSTRFSSARVLFS